MEENQKEGLDALNQMAMDMLGDEAQTPEPEVDLEQEDIPVLEDSEEETESTNEEEESAEETKESENNG